MEKWPESFRSIFLDIPFPIVELLITGVITEKWSKQFAWALARTLSQKFYNLSHATEYEINSQEII